MPPDCPNLGGPDFVKLYSADTLQVLNTFKGHNVSTDSVVFSPNEKILVSVGRDGTVKAWDIFGIQEQDARYLAGSFRAVFSRDGCCLATGGYNAATGANILNINTGKQINFQGKIPDTVLTVAFSPDGRNLATGGKSGNVKIWNALTGQELFTLNGHTGWITSSAFSPNGQILATGSIDSTVRLWNIQDRKELYAINSHSSTVNSVAFSPDGQYLATASDDKTVRFWDVKTMREFFELSHPFSVLFIAFSSDGRKLATATSGGYASLWDIVTRKELQLFKGHVGEIHQLVYSPDGRRIITGGSDGYVKFWDVAAGQEVFSVKTGGIISAMALSPDGKTLYTTPGKLWRADDAGSSTTKKMAKLIELTNARSNVKPADIAPVGWTLVGNRTSFHETGLDHRVAHSGKFGAYIKSVAQLGSLQMNQSIKADAYRGRRVRFSGYLKSDSVQDSARLWMLVSAPGYALQRDIMEGRLIRATTDWTRYEIVLDVPDDSLIITFGFALRGKGQVWADDFQLEIADKSVPPTGEPEFYDNSRRMFLAQDEAERKRREDVSRTRAKNLPLTFTNMGFEKELR